MRRDRRDSDRERGGERSGGRRGPPEDFREPTAGELYCNFKHGNCDKHLKQSHLLYCNNLNIFQKRQLRDRD